MSQRREFLDAHRGATGPLTIDKDEVMLYFPDGATMENGSAYGNVFPPPEDPYQRQKLIVKYWTCLVRRADRAYRKRYAEIAGWAKNCQLGRCYGGPGNAELNALAEMKKELKAYSMILESHQKELERLTPKSVEREARAKAEGQRQTAQFLDQLEKLKI